MGEAGDLAVRYFAALSAGDLDGAVALVADAGDFRSPMGQLQGKDQIRAFLGGFDTAFPGAQFEITKVIESGSSVAVEGAYYDLAGFMAQLTG
jgi:ketosteroid isomerase-like protein